MTPLPGDRLTSSSAVPAVPATVEDSPFRVRAAIEEDLPGLARLDEEVFIDHPYPYFVLRQLYDVYRHQLLVVGDGKALRGYVLVGTPPDASCSWILGLGVDRRFRGHGLGRRLMAEAMTRLRAVGVSAVRLTVEPANTKAIELYESLGFTHVGHRKDYFGPGADRLIMVCSFSGPTSC